MPMFADAAHDALLAYIATNATALHFCSSEPATFSAVSGASLGLVAPTFGAAGAGTPSGRKRTVTSPAGSTYTASGTVAAVALVSGTVLLATVAVTTNKAVNSGDPITASTFDLINTQPVAV